jgi:PAS domain S-box-containing protein
MRYSLSNGGDYSPAAEARLIPVLARALDLGRGPPGLVSWVRSRVPASVTAGRDDGVARRGTLLKRLAGELSRMLPQSALETIVGRGSQPTLRAPAADEPTPRQPAATSPPARGTDARPGTTPMIDAELFYRIFEFAPDAILVVDGGGRIVRANARAEKLFGHTREELAGQQVEVLVPRRFAERHPRFREGYAAAPHPRPMGVGLDLSGLRKDGSEFPVDVMLAPLGPEKGAPVLAVVRDATERKRAEEQARQARETYLKELHHRVKNNLQVISSLLFLQSTRTADPNATAILTESRARVKSIALIHERLSRSPDRSDIDFAGYVRDLVADLAHTYGVDRRRVRVSVNVGEVRLGIDTAIPCGLIINELVSNSLKHAFPGDRGGEVVVELVAGGPRQFTLTVRDDGAGLPAGFERRQGNSLGLKLVSDLTRQLEGTFAVEPGPGAAFRVTFEELHHPERS